MLTYLAFILPMSLSAMGGVPEKQKDKNRKKREHMHNSAENDHVKTKLSPRMLPLIFFV